MKQKVSSACRPMAAAGLVVLGMLAAGVWFYGAQEQRLREGAEVNLQAIAELKANQISAWRAERLADAAVIMESPFFLEGVKRWMTDPQAEGEEGLLTRFRSLRDHYQYCDVLLTDASGQVRLSLAGHPRTLHADAAQVLATAFREHKPVLSDLHAGGTNQAPHLDLVAPLLAKNGETPKPAGAVILQIDAQQFLYPLIRSWPIPSRSAETLLVRRDGDAVLFLSDLRHQQDTALKLRIPLSRTDVPAVMAVLGQEGIVQGKDYRGVRVLSALKAIPDSPWFLVAKVDAAEALSAQRFSAVLILALILAMVAVAAVGMGVIWQRNQKRHYRSLLQTEEAFRVLFEVSSDAIMTLEPPTWRFTSSNPATVKMFKARDEAQFVSKGPWEVSPEFQPDGARSDDKAKAMIGKAMQEGSHFFEWDHLRLDGEVFPATVLLTRVTLGEKVFLQATVRDITEAKKAEEALAFNNIILRTQQELSIDGILVVDEKGEILSSNQRFVDMWGIPLDVRESKSDERALQSMMDRLASPGEFIRTVKHLYEARDETSREEVALKDGRIFDQYSVPMQGAGGKYYGRVWYFRDITERRQAEEQQTRLLQQLGEINQELKDFAYVVSHDLKAPLRAIKALADWLSTDYEDKLDEQGKENLRLLNSRVDRMHNLIDGVLQYSRIGRTEQGTVPVDLNRLVPEIIDGVGAPEHIAIHVEPDLPTVEADVTRITQVFQNLLSNAIKCMDKPQGNITVGCAQDDGFWKFSVADNGPGIEKKDFERIFKLFQTSVSREDCESTGVGLTVAKKIVEMYGGRIWVESEVGTGSTFFFTFPQQEREAHHAYTGNLDRSDDSVGGRTCVGSGQEA